MEGLAFVEHEMVVAPAALVDPSGDRLDDHDLVGRRHLIERGSAKTPLLVKNYEADERAADNSLQTSVAAFGAGVDHCFAAFAQDLERLAK
jgi:hypothetical protein